MEQGGEKGKIRRGIRGRRGEGEAEEKGGEDGEEDGELEERDIWGD